MIKNKQVMPWLYTHAILLDDLQEVKMCIMV